MIKVIICEDDLKTLNLYALIINAYIEAHPDSDLNLVLTTPNPNEIEAHIQDYADEKCLYFLDIEFATSSIRGIDLATKIRGTNLETPLIFITTHDEYSPTTVNKKIDAFDFIYKESGLQNVKTSIELDLDRLVKQFHTHKPTTTATFTYRAGFRDYRLPLSSIDYFESVAGTHKVQLNTANEVSEFSGTISDIQSQYSHLFLAHKSILINVDNIKIIDASKRLVIFNDGLSCAVSRRHLGKLRRVFNASSM